MNWAYMKQMTVPVPLRDGPVVIRFVEEEVSYMADYEVNDRQEIESVRYDPVPVARQEEVWILNRKETFPDT